MPTPRAFNTSCEGTWTRGNSAMTISVRTLDDGARPVDKNVIMFYIFDTIYKHDGWTDGRTWGQGRDPIPIPIPVKVA